MQVIINGEQTMLTDVSTVESLIKHLELSGRLAIEINQQIVPRSEFSARTIADGDVIEIVHAIGGGCP
jgi:sulfur carrier protein